MAIKPLHTFDAAAPKPLIDMYHREFSKHRDAGKSHDESHQRAIRHTQQAGWYKGQKGWKQLHGDVRDKVNVREAVRQPDGRFVIEDVDVFYPNHVKTGLPFSASDIRQIIKNTNRSIGSGSQKPSFLEGHPNEMMAAMGDQADSRGFAVNWKEHPDKKGWARCDLIDVEPEYVQRMRDRKLTGLSAGFARDGAGLNRRFGHVAMLGGTTQALSQLPTHEIFSGQYVCFSAEPESFFKRGPMTLTPKQKACFEAAASAFAAYQAAEQSSEVGEPGAESKMTEAGGRFNEAYSAFSAEMAPQGETPEFEAPVPSPESEQVQNQPVQGVNGEQMPDFTADPAGAFAALNDQVTHLRRSDAENAKVIKTLRVANFALQGRMIKEQFDSEIKKLRDSGRQLPTNIDEQFASALEHKDPKKALSMIVKGLTTLPVKQTPATSGAHFSAADGNIPVAGRARGPAPKMTTAQALDGMNISDEDMKFAALGEAVTAS